MVPISRRHFVGATLAILGAGATAGLPAQGLESEGAENTALDTFMAVSRALTGRSQLDRAVGARLLEALEKVTPSIAAQMPPLARALKSGAPNAQQETVALEIMQAWYVGMVGKVVVTYEQALAFDAVSDNLSIRSYVGGAPLFWAKDPT